MEELGRRRVVEDTSFTTTPHCHVGILTAVSAAHLVFGFLARCRVLAEACCVLTIPSAVRFAAPWN